MDMKCLKCGSVRKHFSSMETGEQTTKGRRKSGSYSERLYGGRGQGPKTIQLPPKTQGQGSHRPPSAPTSVNLILMNNVKRGKGRRKRTARAHGEDNSLESKQDFTLKFVPSPKRTDCRKSSLFQLWNRTGCAENGLPYLPTQVSF